MTTTAILFLVLSGLLIWGGLTVSVIRLRADARRGVTGDDADEVTDATEGTTLDH